MLSFEWGATAAEASRTVNAKSPKKKTGKLYLIENIMLLRKRVNCLKE